MNNELRAEHEKEKQVIRKSVAERSSVISGFVSLLYKRLIIVI